MRTLRAEHERPHPRFFDAQFNKLLNACESKALDMPSHEYRMLAKLLKATYPEGAPAEFFFTLYNKVLSRYDDTAQEPTVHQDKMMRILFYRTFPDTNKFIRDLFSEAFEAHTNYGTSRPVMPDRDVLDVTEKFELGGVEFKPLFFHRINYVIKQAEQAAVDMNAEFLERGSGLSADFKASAMPTYDRQELLELINAAKGNIDLAEFLSDTTPQNNEGFKQVVTSGGATVDQFLNGQENASFLCGRIIEVGKPRPDILTGVDRFNIAVQSVTGRNGELEIEGKPQETPFQLGQAFIARVKEGSRIDTEAVLPLSQHAKNLLFDPPKSYLATPQFSQQGEDSQFGSGPRRIGM